MTARSIGVAHQIPRNSLALLMIAQVVVVLPLAPYISPWIVGVCLFCGYWRTQVYRGRWGYPASWVKTFLVAAAVAGIALSGFQSFSLEAATSLLVVAFALKLVEMKNRRDAYLVIYLSYFLIATGFLFDQSMAVTAYELAASVVVTAAMVGMNQLQTRVRPVASLRVAGTLVLQALPLTLVIFLLFPRIAPLWSIPVPSAATTGLSDTLTPGDIASLGRSDELAFRVIFDGDPPRQSELYWRGLVYSDFVYGTWALAAPLDALPRDSLDAESESASLSYEIFLEPTQSKWLFSLDTPRQYPDRVDLLGDYRLENPEPVMSVMRYKVISDPELSTDPVLDPAIRERESRLENPNDNIRLQAYARDLYERAGSVEAMVYAMMAHIREEPYSYTLNPPTLARYDSIDEFWFDTRRGFCSHYAGAMVYALRSVGVPARMVGGYQGGEINPVTGHMVVRQYDAHAWVEVWIEGKGWQRFDPTAAVAPARVEDGLNAALSSEDRETLSFLSATRMESENVLADALRFFDSLEYRWNLWVVGYDVDTQANVLKKLFGEVTPSRIGVALVLGGAVSLAMVVLGLFFWRKPASSHPSERVFSRFCAAMSRHGIKRLPGETPVVFLERIAEEKNIDVGILPELVQRALYDPIGSQQRSARMNLKKELRKLRFRLALG